MSLEKAQFLRYAFYVKNVILRKKILEYAIAERNYSYLSFWNSPRSAPESIRSAVCAHLAGLKAYRQYHKEYNPWLNFSLLPGIAMNP